LIPDSDWAKEERKRLGIPDDDKFNIQIAALEDAIKFYNERDEEVSSVYSIVSSFYPPGFQEIPPTKIRNDFQEPTFLHTGIGKFPKLKINSLEATISVSKAVEVIQVGGEDFVAFILKNVIDKKEHRFDKDIKLIK
jgi:hypothetical protein